MCALFAEYDAMNLSMQDMSMFDPANATTPCCSFRTYYQMEKYSRQKIKKNILQFV